ncbi:MAG: VWA domain-containing protein [Polyangia bacterium]
MLNQIQEFVALLRKNGVPASTAELLDAVSALSLVGMDDPQLVRAVLKTCLVKRAEDESRFDDLFGLFFFRAADLLSSSPDAPLAVALAQAGFSEEQIERAMAALATEAARLDPTARLGLGLRRVGLDLLLRLSGLRIDVSRMQSSLQVGYFTQGLIDQLGFRQAESELRGLMNRLSPELGPELAQTVLRQAEQNLWQLRGALRGEVQRAFEKQNLRFAETQRSELLSQKPLSQLSAHELALRRHQVVRLADKLKTQQRDKPQRQQKGRLDMRRTLRAALSSGGIPFRLRFRTKHPHKPRLVILCDISDSVRQVARFMLQLAYTLQERFSKVRSFVFVSDLGDATELFESNEIERAVEKTYSGAIVSVASNSNYGRALRQFVEKHLEAVTSRTTVIVIGDGRSNYFPSEAWALARVKARARHVLWLNPEQPSSWSFGDSAMRDYLPHVSRAETVTNLQSLRRVIDELLL